MYKQPYQSHTSEMFKYANEYEALRLGDVIRNAEEQGVSASFPVEMVFDDDDTDAVDPLGDPRTDRFDMVEKATIVERARMAREMTQKAGLASSQSSGGTPPEEPTAGATE